MAEREHPWTSVAQELQGWLESESQWYAEALRGGHRSPFSADVSEREKLDFYRRQMFQTADDDTIQYDKPNVQGRQNLLTRLGVQGYAQVYDAVRPKQGMRPVLEAEDDESAE